jgi:hypothetical protein
VLLDSWCFGLWLTSSPLCSDWHNTWDRGGPLKNNVTVQGWSGYTFNEGLLPSPATVLRWLPLSHACSFVAESSSLICSQFLQYLKRRGVVTTFNMHPAAGLLRCCASHVLELSCICLGIQYVEATYQAACRALAYDCSGSLPIPYNLTDTTYAKV